MIMADIISMNDQEMIMKKIPNEFYSTPIVYAVVKEKRL